MLDSAALQKKTQCLHHVLLSFRIVPQSFRIVLQSFRILLQLFLQLVCLLLRLGLQIARPLNQRATVPGIIHANSSFQGICAFLCIPGWCMRPASEHDTDHSCNRQNQDLSHFHGPKDRRMIFREENYHRQDETDQSKSARGAENPDPWGIHLRHHDRVVDARTDVSSLGPCLAVHPFPCVIGLSENPDTPIVVLLSCKT